jgi:hypothetical protein
LIVQTAAVEVVVVFDKLMTMTMTMEMMMEMANRMFCLVNCDPTDHIKHKKEKRKEGRWKRIERGGISDPVVLVLSKEESFFHINLYVPLH